MLGGVLFALVGAYPFARSERLTATSFEMNRRVLRGVLGDERTARMLSPTFARATVVHGRAFGVALIVLGAVLVVAGRGWMSVVMCRLGIHDETEFTHGSPSSRVDR